MTSPLILSPCRNCDDTFRSAVLNDAYARFVHFLLFFSFYYGVIHEKHAFRRMLRRHYAHRRRAFMVPMGRSAATPRMVRLSENLF